MLMPSAQGNSFLQQALCFLLAIDPPFIYFCTKFKATCKETSKYLI